MKRQDRSAVFGIRRNRKQAHPLRSPRASRRMFLEPLEPRQMLSSVTAGDALLESFPGNYYPPQQSRFAGQDLLSAAATGSPLTVAINYLNQNGVTYGLTATDLSTGHYAVTNQYADSDTGETHIYLQQFYNGLPVADAVAAVNLLSTGEVVTASANFVAGLTYPAGDSPLSPSGTAEDAVASFAAAAGITYDGQLGVISAPAGRSQRTTFVDADLSSDPIVVQLQYVPSPSGGVELAWEIIDRPPAAEHWFDLAIGAEGSRAGQVVRVADWVAHAAGPNASYNVFPVPLKDPADGNRSIVVNPQDAAASPLGWHDINGIAGADFPDTRGNNVFAQDDVAGTFLGGTRPQGGTSLNFDFPLDTTLNPSTYLNAATTQLFYGVNIAHDVAAHQGFNEAAGNFQFRNYSGNGLAGDPVRAFSQSAIAPNNAFIIVPPEGISPLMAVGLEFLNFSGVALGGQPVPNTPPRDIDLDNVTIFHEFFHGVSSRLTGGPANAGALQALQSRGMGEGWSDWFGTTLTLKPTDNKNTPQLVGEWTDPPNGIRRYPYSFDLSVDPLTLDRYNGDLFPQQNNSEVHNAGEIWASTLIDMTWLLIEKYGFTNDLYNGKGGQNLAMKLVFEALKLQPTNPTFTQARDAIFAADKVINGGRDFYEIWTAFARRGFGMSSNSFGSACPFIFPNCPGTNANSLFVFEVFDQPAPKITIGGTLFHDVDGDGVRDSGEVGLGGWTVYDDANKNGVMDLGEARTTTAADGSYAFFFFNRSISLNLREVVPAGWRRVAPTSGAFQFTATSGQAISSGSFANQLLPAEIDGTKWNDLNGDGVKDPGEPGLQGLVIYVDLNNDGKVGVLEPSAITDQLGNYAIKTVPAGGTNYIVREILQPSMVQTFPGPSAPVPNAQTIASLAGGQKVTGINFGNTAALDWGDAPNTYGTTQAAGGPRHAILTGFHLGAFEDAEVNGQPTADALGDDFNTDDEDGIQFVTGLTPGTISTIRVTVSTGGNFTGKLHGWIDFNRDGDFLDAGEKVISNLLLGDGVHNVTFPVPTSISLGPTFARFRYGYENDLGPKGPSAAGEVEDYAVSILSNVPIAAPDVFPRPTDPLIKQGSVDNVLDVLANDTGTTFGPARIVAGSFPATLATGSTLKLDNNNTPNDPTDDRILFTPGPNSFGAETFTYQVTDGQTVSAPGLVTVNITVRDPKVIDDTVVVPFATTPVQTVIHALANDVFPNVATTKIISVLKLTGSVLGDTMTVAANGADLNFTAPPGFKGTIIYQYSIDDTDPITSAGVGRVTVQVVDVVGGVPQPSSDSQTGHLAQLVVQILDPANGQPLSAVSAGGQFLVRVLSQDLRAGGSDSNRGVEAAYLDLIYNRNFAEPVLDAANPFGFSITFNSLYNSARSGKPNSPAQGEIDEAGASHLVLTVPSTPVGTGLIPVFSVLMRAKAATPTGQPLQVFGDPADANSQGQDFSQIVLSSNNPGDPINFPPVAVADERVFLRPSSPLVILGSGEGEFTNLGNPLDVSGDGYVTSIDALQVFNELNAHGPRLLSPLDFIQGGVAVPTSYLDVNIDSYVAPIDALMVINALNTLSASSGAGGEGESGAWPASVISGGEGEGSSAGSTSDSGLAMLVFTAPVSPATSNESSAEVVGTAPTSPTPTVLSPDATLTSFSQTNDQPIAGSDSGNVEPDAADEIFAKLLESGASDSGDLLI